MPRRIGGDWVEVEDENTGKIYYANIKTKEVSWKKPKDINNNNTNNTNNDIKESEGEDVITTSTRINPWVERKDPKSGRIYYYHRITKERTWHQPKSFKPLINSIDDPDKWICLTEETTGKNYYYNVDTKETTWLKPVCIKDETRLSQILPDGITEILPPNILNLPDPPNINDNIKQDDNEDNVINEHDNNNENGINDNDEKKNEEDDEITELNEKFQSVNMRKKLRRYESILKEEEESKQTKLDRLVNEFGSLDIKEYADENYRIAPTIAGNDNILKWTDEIISSSLLKLNAELTIESVQCFRNISGYMGDRNSSKQGVEHAKKLLKNMLSSPVELCDEFYCQIIKQTTDNPNIYSCILGWQLFALATATFPSSSEIAPYISSHCAKNVNHEEITIQHLAKYALNGLQKIAELGPRNEIPTETEIQATLHCEYITVRIHFVGRTYLWIEVTPWDTALSLLIKIKKLLQIEDITPYSLFEVSSYDTERVLEETERISDLIAYWHHEELQNIQKHGKKSKSLETFRLYMKIRLFLTIPENDPASIDLHYHQARYDIIDERYPCSRDDYMALAALQLQEEYGNSPYNINQCFQLNGKMYTYLPKTMVSEVINDKDKENELKNKIYEMYIKLRGYDQLESRLSYLNYVNDWKSYGCTFWIVKPHKNNAELPEEVVMGINKRGVIFIDPETKQYIAEFLFDKIITWGCSENSFLVVLGKPNANQKKYYFKTEFSKDINDLMKLYSETLFGKAENNDENDN